MCLGIYTYIYIYMNYKRFPILSPSTSMVATNPQHNKNHAVYKVPIRYTLTHWDSRIHTTNTQGQHTTLKYDI